MRVIVVRAVVVAAQHGEVVEVGLTAVSPRGDVVCFAVIGAVAAVGNWAYRVGGAG